MTTCRVCLPSYTKDKPIVICEEKGSVQNLNDICRAFRYQNSQVSGYSLLPKKNHLSQIILRAKSGTVKHWTESRSIISSRLRSVPFGTELRSNNKVGLRSDTNERFRIFQSIDKEFQKDDENNVTYAMLGIRTILYWLVVIILEGLNKFLKIPIPSKVEDAILEKIGAPYKPKGREKVLLKQLREIKGVMRAMKYLTTDAGRSPEDAFEILAKHMLIYKPSYRKALKNPELLNGQYELERGDILKLYDREGPFDLTFGEMRLAVKYAGSAVARPKAARKLIEIIDEAIPPAVVEIDLLETQTRESKRLLEAKLLENYGRLTTSLLEMMINEVEGRESYTEKFIFNIAGERLVLDFSSTPEERRTDEIKRYLEMWKVMLASIRETGKLSTEHISLINSLIGEYPLIDRFKKLSGGNLETLIEASRRGIELLVSAHESKNPLSNGIQIFLDELGEVKDGALGFRLDGGRTHVAISGFGRAEHVQPLMVYNQHSARVGPYSFYEREIANIGADGIMSREPALLIVDRRSSPSIVSLSDMLTARRFMTELRSNPRTRRSTTTEIRRFVYLVYNDLQAAWSSVKWQNVNAVLTPSEGSPDSVMDRSISIAKLSPGYELLRAIRQVCRLLLDLKKYNLMDKGSFADRVSEEFSRLKKKYIDFFSTEESKTQFADALKGVSRAVESDDVLAVRSKRNILKDILYKTMDQLSGLTDSRYVGNVRTIFFGEEVKWFMAIINGPEELRERAYEKLAILRARQDQEPSIDAARSLVKEQKFEQALNEYYRVITEQGTKVSERITTLSELFSVAYVLRDAISMNKVLAELAYLVYLGHEVDNNIKTVVRDALTLEDAGVITVPLVLRNAMGDRIGSRKASDIVVEALSGDLRPEFSISDRFPLLKKAVREMIDKHVDSAKSDGLQLFDSDFLRRIPTMTREEFDSVLEKIDSAGHFRDELESLYELRKHVVDKGYNLNEIRTTKVVKELAEMPSGFVVAERVVREPLTSTLIPTGSTDSASDSGKSAWPYSRTMPSPLIGQGVRNFIMPETDEFSQRRVEFAEELLGIERPDPADNDRSIKRLLRGGEAGPDGIIESSTKPFVMKPKSFAKRDNGFFRRIGRLLRTVRRIGRSQPRR